MKSAEVMNVELSLKKRKDYINKRIKTLGLRKESILKDVEAENKIHYDNIYLIEELKTLLRLNYDYKHGKKVYHHKSIDETSEVDKKEELLKERISKLRHETFCKELQTVLTKMYYHPTLAKDVTKGVNGVMTYAFHRNEPSLAHQNILLSSRLALLANSQKVRLLEIKIHCYQRELTNIEEHEQALTSPPMLFRFVSIDRAPKVEYRRLSLTRGI